MARKRRQSEGVLCTAQAIVPQLSPDPCGCRSQRWLLRAVTFALAVSVPAACAYHGASQDSPLSRRFSWFSYLNGDDLRARCVPGAPATYRFVYNGVYVQQVRTYDVLPSGSGDRADLRVRVIGPADLSDVQVRLQVSTLFQDLTAPWRGKIDTVPLTSEDLAKLDRSLAASGVFRPAPAGLRLRGEDFFWIAAVCVNGSFTFNAFKWDSPEFAALTFPQLLLSWDPTGVPLNPPRSLSPFDIYGQTAPEPGSGPTFSLTVGDNGLAAIPRLF